MNRNLAGFKLPYTSTILDGFPNASPTLIDKVELSINEIRSEGREAAKAHGAPMERRNQNEISERSATWRDTLKQRIKHDWQEHFSKAKELMQLRGATFDQNVLPLALSHRIRSDKDQTLALELEKNDSPRSIATRIKLWLDQEKMSRQNDKTSASSFNSSICPATVKAKIRNHLKESNNQKRPRRRPITPQRRFRKYKPFVGKCSICGKEKDGKKPQGIRKPVAVQQPKSAKIKQQTDRKSAKQTGMPADFFLEDLSEVNKATSSSSMFIPIKTPTGLSKLPQGRQYSKQVFKWKIDNRKDHDVKRLAGGFDAYKIPPTSFGQFSKYMDGPHIDNRHIPTPSNSSYMPGRSMFLARLQPRQDNWLDMLDKKAKEDRRLGNKREIGFPWSVGRTAYSKMILKQDESSSGDDQNACDFIQKPIPKPETVAQDQKRLPCIRGLAKATEILKTDDGKSLRNSLQVHKKKLKSGNHHNKKVASSSTRARPVLDKRLAENSERKKAAKQRPKTAPRSGEPTKPEQIFTIFIQPKPKIDRAKKSKSPKRNEQAKEVERLKGGYDDAPRMSGFRPRQLSDNFQYQQYVAHAQKNAARKGSVTITTPQQSEYRCDYCDKTFAKEHALHIHLMDKCLKIPPRLKKHLNFNDLNHERKPRVPSFPRPNKMEKKVIKYDETPVKRYPIVQT